MADARPRTSVDVAVDAALDEYLTRLERIWGNTPTPRIVLKQMRREHKEAAGEPSLDLSNSVRCAVDTADSVQAVLQANLQAHLLCLAWRMGRDATLAIVIDEAQDAFASIPGTAHAWRVEQRVGALQPPVDLATRVALADRQAVAGYDTPHPCGTGPAPVETRNG